MSTWPGKFVIGLTGNIATGKSVVRRMLEHAGAFGIDADALSHRAISSDAPGYAPVVQEFGKYILKADGEIDRKKLGQIVFSDPNALSALEAIVHPLVRQAVDHLVRKSQHRVVVIEAIKLLESPLKQTCDAIWVVTASEDTQLRRLQQNGMAEEEAKQRMLAQTTQEAKTAAADTVISNSDSIMETWEQVKRAWKKLFPTTSAEAVTARLHTPISDGLRTGLKVLRARPRQAAEIAQLMSNGGSRIESQAVINAFGDKAFLLLQGDDGLKGLLGWKVENLVARVDEIHFSPGVSLTEHMPFLVSEVEEASKELQCEIALIYVPPTMAAYRDLWQKLGYEERLPSELTVSAWQEAAVESAKPGTVMLFKQLRADRVLRPI